MQGCSCAKIMIRRKYSWFPQTDNANNREQMKLIVTSPLQLLNTSLAWFSAPDTSDTNFFFMTKH